MNGRQILARCLATAAFGMLATATNLFAQDGALPTFDREAKYEYFNEGDTVRPVALDVLEQPEEGMPMTAPAAPPRATTPARRAPAGSRQGSIRLASVPNMFGDVFLTSGRVQTEGPVNGGSFGGSFAGGVELPSAGGSRRVKIAENNVAMPTDRIFFNYNHFHNALSIQERSLAPPGPNVIRQAPIDRYTLGFEKMFFDDLWSCEVRMPFVSSFDARTEAFAVDGGNIGNLAIILKNLLYTSDSFAVAAGVGLDMPTGSDFNTQIGAITLDFENDSFHILPFVGFAGSFDEMFFLTGFAQIDIATCGNEVIVRDVGGQPIVLANGGNSLGFLTEQNLMYFDLAGGMWVFRDPDARRLTGVAVMGEVHYTTTVQDSDEIVTAIAGTPLRIDNPFNRQDIVNATIALQAEIGMTTVRIAGVFPLGQEPDERFFDSEVQLQLNRRF